MTDLSLDLIGSDNTIVIDGGLVKSALYAPLLAALRPGQIVHTSNNPEGSALGAAALVFDAVGKSPFINDCAEAAPLPMPGLDDYRRTWRQMVETMQGDTAPKEKRA
ncbi:hypothetical protein [Rhizobium sp. G21]|uniref:hypothetical protein n=1 Tax=Rhizobium sp. G21 TaxID=2758439 RepID=UPI003917E8E7